MFFEKKKGIVSLVLAGCMVFTAEFEVFAADPQSEAQAMNTNYEMEMAPLADTWNEISAMASVAVDTQEWYGKALANTDSELDVYAEANGTVIGKMYSNTIVTVEEGEEWSKISSGSVVGYVRTESLLFGSAAVERAAVTCAETTRDAQTLEEIEAEKRKQEEIKLMAAIIYCEAGNQSYEGKVAVGAVIMNRIESGRFPNTLEGVIYQRGQFTPAMTGKLARVLASGNIPASCYDAAIDSMNGANPIGNALFFNMHSGKFKLGDHYFS
ncbi:MAG: cell wall hydrolase [Tyzzerella sp.]|nr:cell wall hydrolase [Tyzzerella sp.]